MIKVSLRLKHLLVMCIMLAPWQTQASEKAPLVFSYWTKASAPFIFVEDGELASGIIKDIGEHLGKTFNRKVSFLELPSKRIEPYLISGEVDFDCITNPVWKDSPDAYLWSPVLFSGADRFIVRSAQESDIQEFADLKGKILGIYNGYVYNPKIMQMMAQDEVISVKADSVEKGMYLLGLKRIDALIDFGIILRYQLKNLENRDDFRIATLPADEFDLFCAYSPKTDLSNEQIDQAFKTLSNDGAIDAILQKYR